MNAVLQSIGRIHMPLVSAGIALVIQTVVLVILILTTDLGVHALVLCSVLYSVLIFIIDSRFICKYLRMHLRIYRVYGRPVVAAAVMGIVTNRGQAVLRQPDRDSGGHRSGDRRVFLCPDPDRRP